MAIFLLKKYLKSVCHKIKNILNIIPAFFQKKDRESLDIFKNLAIL